MRGEDSRTTRRRASVGRNGEALVACYAREAMQLSQVRRVALDTSGPEPEIWTVIEAKPGAVAPREAVYAAELRAAKAQPDASAAFRLINAADFPGRLLDDLLPDAANILYSS